MRVGVYTMYLVYISVFSCSSLSFNPLVKFLGLANLFFFFFFQILEHFHIQHDISLFNLATSSATSRPE